MKYHVYIIRSLKNGSYYKGYTNDIDRRLKEHNEGKEIATARYAPWVLECSIGKNTKNEALILERKIKNITSIVRLKKFIEKYT